MWVTDNNNWNIDFHRCVQVCVYHFTSPLKVAWSAILKLLVGCSLVESTPYRTFWIELQPDQHQQTASEWSRYDGELM